jgi:halocyanin-like protein
MVTDDPIMNRRNVIKATGAIITSTALAGCSSAGGIFQSSNNGTGENQETETEVSFPESFGGWMEEVDNYDSVADMTGRNEITIDVAAEGNGGHYAFEPPAVGISANTTVIWKWTGEGAAHNVIAKNGSFESELTGKEGHTFEQTFENNGTYKYNCGPHEQFGMKGVIIVV